MSSNPWIDRFDPQMPEDRLRSLAEVKSVPITDLAREKDHEVAGMRLRKALESIFVPTKQIVSLVRKLIGIARAHAMERYPDEGVYRQHVYERIIPTSIPPVAVMSLAGVGKTEAFKALQRVLPQPSKIDIPYHGEEILEAARMVTVRPGGSLRSLLELRPCLSGHTKLIDPSRDLLTKGVCLNIADEIQFIAQSGASTQVTKTLLQMNRLGPPLAYGANYSLINRLWLRNQEETQRLLTSPVFLEPDIVDSEDWVLTLGELFRAALEFARLATETVGEQIHDYTFGIKRLVVLLLVLTLLHARQRGTRFAQSVDLERAYFSPEYARARADVDLLVSQRQTGVPVETGKIRHLWCDLPRDSSTTAHSTSRSPSPRGRLPQDISPEALLDKTGRKNLEAERAKIGTKMKSTPSKRSPRSKATPDAMAAGAYAFASRTKIAVGDV